MTAEDTLLRAKAFVRRCLFDIMGQAADEETIEKVARKVIRALPKSVRGRVDTGGGG